MNTRTSKGQKNKRQSMASSMTRNMRMASAALHIKDRRPENDEQLSLTELANQSTQIHQTNQLQAKADQHASNGQLNSYQANMTGMPDQLKVGIENMSGLSMDDVKVHYNSEKPAQLNAHAYAQGTEIHLGAGQEKHLPHEAWHVVQQKQGRVSPTFQMKGKAVNEDHDLEREADEMGEKVLRNVSKNAVTLNQTSNLSNTIQRKLYYASNSDRSFSNEDEIRAFLAGALSSDVSEAQLLEAHNSEQYFFVNFRGSIAGRHGYEILDIGEYTARPAVAGRGTAGIRASDNAAGFEVTGRPAWTEETIGKLRPIKFRDNIRHIIPYHMIKDGFMAWLNNVFATHGEDTNEAKVELVTIALKLGVTVENPADVTPEAFHSLSISILGQLNNVPGNLWSGDKTENQRLNSLRLRIEGIKAAVIASDEKPGTVAFSMLMDSLGGDGDKVYKEILKGAVEHFPEDVAEREAMNQLQVIGILDRLHVAGEVDAMPSAKELERFGDNVEAYLSNMPLHFLIFQLYQKGDFENAMLVLSELTDPYPAYVKE